MQFENLKIVAALFMGVDQFKTKYLIAYLIFAINLTFLLLKRFAMSLVAEKYLILKRLF